jgi:hypothetical protein
MKKGVLMGSLAALLMFCAITNASNSRDLKVVNSTGYPIKYFSINQPGDKAWSENELSAVLKDKEKFTMTFEGAGKGCTWNIKVMWADNNSSSIYKGVDLCKIKVLAIKYDRKTDTPTFTAE